MRYQFVDCRWALGEPQRGRELYLAGHIPGASFLDVDADLSAPPGPRGRHPLPDAGEFARVTTIARFGPPADTGEAARRARIELRDLKRRLRRGLFVLDRARGLVSVRSLGLG